MQNEQTSGGNKTAYRKFIEAVSRVHITRARNWILFTALLLMARSLPVLGTVGECIEVWNYSTDPRYMVDLDTGETTLYEIDLRVMQYLSPDGSYKLQFSGVRSTLNLVDLATVDTRTIADYVDDPDWSSDGLHFTYRDVSLPANRLFLYDIATTTSRLVGENVVDHSVQFSKDGQWFAYRQEAAPGKDDLILYNIADGTRRVVSHDVFLSKVGWSPDGRWLTRIQGESREATRFELILYNVFTAEESVFSFDTPTNYSSFAWSSDAVHIALVVTTEIEGEYAEVYILSAPDLHLVETVNPMLSRVEAIWSPSGRWLILTARDTADFAMVDLSAQPVTIVPVQLGTHAPYYFWSPDETYMIVYHGAGDLATEFKLLNRRGEVIVDAYVRSSLYDFKAHHWWVDAHHLLLKEWDDGLDALILFDARRGERHTLFHPVSGLAVSSDHERVTLTPLLWESQSFQTSRRIRFYDWTGETFTLVRIVTTADEPRDMLWRADRSELIVLFEEQTLRAYNYETETWRSITTLPDTNSWSIRAAPCFGQL